MAAIKQLLVVLIIQPDAIWAVVTAPAISKPSQPKKITPIPNSHHHTPHIIKNDDRYITSFHRVIAHHSNLLPHIVPPDNQHPRSMGKYLHVSYPRVANITQPTPVLLPSVPTAQHQYNIRPKQQLSYSCTQTGKILFGHKCHHCHGNKCCYPPGNRGVSII